MEASIQKVVDRIRHDNLAQILRERFQGYVDNRKEDIEAYNAAHNAIEKEFYPDLTSREIFYKIFGRRAGIQ